MTAAHRANPIPNILTGLRLVAGVVMFAMMYLNTYAFDHVWFSQTRAWMALYMGGGMAVVMLAAMWSMSMWPGTEKPHRWQQSLSRAKTVVMTSA